MNRGYVVLLAYTNLAALPGFVESFSAPNTSSNSIKNSPWKTASWQLVLNIGREEKVTSLPEEWGQSGARLSFPVKIEVESDRLPEHQQDALLGGRGSNRVSVVNPEKITYINDQGEQTVPFQARTGGWKLRMGKKKGHASLLRFWLDLGGSNKNIVAQKKDVTLQAQERLYFAAHCWRESDWNIGRKKMLPLVEAYERAQEKLEEQVSHDSGDRRLDGSDPLETLAAYKDMAGLTLDRDDKRRQYLDAQEYLPAPENLMLGNWPGSTELMAVQPMEIFVKRKEGILSKEEYHLVGSWTAKPLDVVPEESEDEYEYNNDDEELEVDDDEYEYYYYYDDDDDDEEEERSTIEGADGMIVFKDDSSRQ